VSDDMTPARARALGRQMGCDVGEPIMTREACENRRYAHNNRMRFTNGYYCEDCGAWIRRDDERWFFTNSFGVRQDK